MDIMALVLLMLVFMTFSIFMLTRFVSQTTSQSHVIEDPRFQRELLSRIEPIGTVAVAGEASADAGAVADVGATPEPVAEILSGPQVYNSACLACHGAGIGGAPKIGDAALWAPRIAQGREIIDAHVLEGYQGADGYMPPKGGRIDLSDEEIIAAVDYMLEQSQ